MVKVRERRADGRSGRREHPPGRVNPWSLAVLFVAIVAIALVLVGVAVRGSPAWWVIFPLLLGCWSIFGLKHR